MKQLHIILSILLASLVLISCEEDPQVIATKLTLKPQSITLKVGETQRLEAIVEPQDKGFVVSFESDNPQVATVNADGLINAVAEGNATIIAKVGSISQSCEVSVIKGGGIDTPEKISLTVDTTSLQLYVGDMGQIDYSVTPEDTPVSFESDRTDVASVDASGMVTAVAQGDALVTVTAGDQVATVSVKVSAHRVAEMNELPYLQFNVWRSPEIIGHEANVGRVEEELEVFSQKIDGFINTDLSTITATIYGVYVDWFDRLYIYAFSRETVASCDATLAMLAEYGFTNIESTTFNDQTVGLSGYKDGESWVQVVMYDETYEDLESHMVIEFSIPNPVEPAHALLSTIQDFPSYEALMTKDVAQIQAFETELSLRRYSSETSDRDNCNLEFVTTDPFIPKTNFKKVSYLANPWDVAYPYIDSEVNFISTPADLTDPLIKDWLALNGFTNDFQLYPEDDNWIEVYDATGQVTCQLFYSKVTQRFHLQIFENSPANQILFNTIKKSRTLMPKSQVGASKPMILIH